LRIQKDGPVGLLVMNKVWWIGIFETDKGGLVGLFGNL